MTLPLSCALAPVLAAPLLAPTAWGHESTRTERSAEPTAAQVVDAANAFAFEFLRAADGDGGNLVCSPASTYMALLLAYAGAEGETAAELARVLHLMDADDLQPIEAQRGGACTSASYATLTDDESHLHCHGCPPRCHVVVGESAIWQNALGRAWDRDAALAAARVLLRGANGVDGAPQLSIANSLWNQSGHPLLPAYLRRTEGELDASLFDVDFRADPRAARQAINTWVGRATEGRIPELLDETDVSALTRLVLTNAVHFQAAWADQFETRDTRPAPFTRADGERVSVPTMRRLDHERILEDEDFQLLELGYQRSSGDDPGPRWSMLVLLPREGRDLADLESELSPERLAQWCAQLQTRRVDVSLPRFQIQSRLDLRATLERMGLESLFDPSRCDLTGMDGGASALVFDKVVHQAEVTVDEHGTEASAATALVQKTGAAANPPQPVTFRADRPFLFMVRDQASGQILFTGRVADPR